MSNIVVICGQQNSGKTTWVCALIDVLNQMGLRVGTVKHTHHDYAVVGKDSTRHQDAGAEQVLLVSPTGAARYQSWTEEPPVEQLVEEHFSGYDLVLVEGYRWTEFPKIIVGEDPRANPVGLITVVPDVSDGICVTTLAEVAAQLADRVASNRIRLQPQLEAV